ncbi:MAG TPA: hypothetical protein VFX65_04155 [Candidatus Limnocylindrales bacterium]|nr:hypothetical protein [Candidatus Limnocylindrales bacterium]
MRPSRTVAIAVLIAALALGALPGLAGSRETSREQPLDAASFRDVIFAAAGGRSIDPIGAPDSASAAAGRLDASTPFGEAPVGAELAVAARPAVAVPRVSAAWEWKPPRRTMTGYATFYDNGTTAMRLPRGTVVVVCGAGGCLERVVNDYGPVKKERIIDLYRPDFFDICGCGWWAGTTWVTVWVY